VGQPRHRRMRTLFSPSTFGALFLLYLLVSMGQQIQRLRREVGFVVEETRDLRLYGYGKGEGERGFEFGFEGVREEDELGVDRVGKTAVKDVAEKVVVISEGFVGGIGQTGGRLGDELAGNVVHDRGREADIQEQHTAVPSNNELGIQAPSSAGRGAREDKAKAKALSPGRVVMRGWEGWERWFAHPT
jgi:hypothetical protein